MINYLNFERRTPVKFIHLIPGIDESSAELLSKMVCYNPNKRLSASECLSHPAL